MARAPTRQDTIARERVPVGWAFALILGAAILVSMAVDGSPEAEILRRHHVAMADYFLGDASREVLTYPLWGYPLLLALLTPPGVLVLQVLLGSLAATAFWRTACPTRAMLALLVLGLPWHILHAALWSMSVPASLSVLAIVLLAKSMSPGRIALAVPAGALLGLALNVRSDALLFPFLVVGVACSSRVWRTRCSLRLGSSLLFAAVSLASLAPWSSWYHRHTHHYSLTSSNGGMVAMVSLGQLPGNPWGAQNDDAFAQEALRRIGIDTPPYSDEGDRVLRRMFRESIANHPGAFALKTIFNLRSVFLGGFYVGTPAVPETEIENLRVFREKFKLALRLNPHFQEIEGFRASGAWNRATMTPRVAFVLAWLVSGAVAGSLFLVLVVTGVVATWRSALDHPLPTLLLVFMGTQLALVTLLQYQPRHANILFLLGAPFAFEAIPWGARVLAARIERDKERAVK